MKRKIVLISTISLTSLTCVACNNSNSNENSVVVQSVDYNDTSNKIISTSEAREIALNNAKLNESDVRFIHCYYQFDGTLKTYNIKFYHNLDVYEYKINGKTGDILYSDHEPGEYITPKEEDTSNDLNSVESELNDNIDIDNNQESESNNSNNPSSIQQGINNLISGIQNGINNLINNSNSLKEKISEDKAKEIALNDTGLSSDDVSFFESNLEDENGIECYKIKFNYNSREYYYVIDAHTGNITSRIIS